MLIMVYYHDQSLFTTRVTIETFIMPKLVRDSCMHYIKCIRQN